MLSLKTIALILFIVMYILLLTLSNYRAYVTCGFAIVFVLLNILPATKVLNSIDFNVILMIGGTMGTVFYFIESKMPAKIASYIIAKTPNVKWCIIALSVFAGVVSAFIDNVATVLMIAPIALSIAKQLKISPVEMIIGISIASNLEGAATLVGDTTSILLGGYAGMNFLDFFFYQGRPGLFFINQVAIIASTFVLSLMLKKYNQPVDEKINVEVSDYIPTYTLVLTVLSLIVASFIPNDIDILNGLICCFFFLVTIIFDYGKNKGDNKVLQSLKEIDFFTLFQLMGLFVVIGGVKEIGIIDDISHLFIVIGGDNIFLIYTIIVFGSVIASAFIDNIPYVATMLPVVAGLSTTLNIDPTVLYFGLLIGATLGGNITPIGASANIAACGMLRKDGYPVSTTTFMKLSVPYTLTAVLVGYISVWLLFGI